jgi:thiamine biosynthesis lipoprotein
MSTLRVEFAAIGTTATALARSAADLVAARAALDTAIEEIDRACSRFRADSEVMQLAAADGKAIPVSDVLWEALAVAGRAAAVSDGLVDATVGNAIIALGYDRDFAEVDARRAWDAGATDARLDVVRAPEPAPGWDCISLDEERRRVAVPAGLVLDLGATAKALAVDRAADAAARSCAGGVLLGIGGDLVVCGPVPPGGWPVRVSHSHRAEPDEPGQTVALHGGALATSSTSVRRWGPPGDRRHHIVDPRTGRPAAETWRTVSVAAASCVDANIASTAGILLGADAPAWLGCLGLPARLEAVDGTVVTTAGWPVAEVAA